VIELRPIRGRIAGALLLPAGLSRKQGVVLQFEESAPGSSQRFLAQFKGCLVDLDLDETTVEKLASSRYLHITAEAERGGEVNFAIPLNGLANALARARSIGKHFS
jgi:invasion protein IalB